MATKPPPDLSTSILAALPSPPVLSAIGEYYIRFAQLEAWLDVMAGALLEIDWPATQSITANLNMHAKIDMLRSLIALRIKKHGDTPSRQTLDKLLQEAASINDHRAALAHSRFILPSEAGAITNL